jgi:formamidopyrimidine-DNA glycosylase
VPELPDVEHFRRFLARHATGARIERVVTTDPQILRNTDATALDDALRGRRFEEPARHGKWLLAWTTGPAVLIHFGMTGDLGWAPGPEGRHRHDRVIFETERGELRYRNMRKLGGVWLASGPEGVDELLGHLGPDALRVRRTEFLELLGKRRGRVKATLLDQSFVAGVGNLVADEALWRARLHPARPIRDLSPDDRAVLFRELRSVLRHEVDRSPGGSQTRWTIVRGRPGGRCPRCRTELLRTVVAGRTTYLCPNCQGVRYGSSSALGPSW